jgi:hypothetical protein
MLNASFLVLNSPIIIRVIESRMGLVARGERNARSFFNPK